jgi:hypothetical protein
MFLKQLLQQFSQFWLAVPYCLEPKGALLFAQSERLVQIRSDFLPPLRAQYGHAY